mgnify:FL=1
MSEYLPYLCGLYDCTLSDKILLSDEHKFTWRSMLVCGSKFQLNGLLYEMCAMHMLYATALSNEAVAIVDSLGAYEQNVSLRSDECKRCNDRLKMATDLLCRASGVCDYVATQLLPSGTARPDSALPSLPPELRHTGILACSKLAMADAHALAIRKLLASAVGTDQITPGPPLPAGHASPSLLAKLHLHTSALYHQAHTLASHSVGVDASSPKDKLVSKLSSLRPDSHDGLAAWLKYASFEAHVHKVLAYKWLGIDAGEYSHKPGWALAYLDMASVALDELMPSKAREAWRIASKKSRKETRLVMEYTSVRRWFVAYKKMNDTVCTNEGERRAGGWCGCVHE